MKTMVLISNWVFAISAFAVFFAYFWVYAFSHHADTDTFFSFQPFSLFTWSMVIVVIVSIVLSHIGTSEKVSLAWALLPIVYVLFAIGFFIKTSLSDKAYYKNVDEARTAIVNSISKDFLCHGAPSDLMSEGSFLTVDHELNAVVSINVDTSLKQIAGMVGKIEGDTLHVPQAWNTTDAYGTCRNTQGKTIFDAYKIVKNPDVDTELQDKIWAKYKIDVTNS